MGRSRIRPSVRREVLASETSCRTSRTTAGQADKFSIYRPAAVGWSNIRSCCIPLINSSLLVINDTLSSSVIQRKTCGVLSQYIFRPLSFIGFLHISGSFSLDADSQSDAPDCTFLASPPKKKSKRQLSHAINRVIVGGIIKAFVRLDKRRKNISGQPWRLHSPHHPRPPLFHPTIAADHIRATKSRR